MHNFCFCTMPHDMLNTIALIDTNLKHFSLIQCHLGCSIIITSSGMPSSETWSTFSGWNDEVTVKVKQQSFFFFLRSTK